MISIKKSDFWDGTRASALACPPAQSLIPRKGVAPVARMQGWFLSKILTIGMFFMGCHGQCHWLAWTVHLFKDLKLSATSELHLSRRQPC